MLRRRPFVLGLAAGFLARPALLRAQALGFGAGLDTTLKVGGGGGAGPSDTPWDIVTFGTGITFSNGNLTANYPTGNVCSRSNNSKSSGKLYANLVIGPAADSIGAGNASTPLGSFLGSDNNSVALQLISTNTARFFNGFSNGTTAITSFPWATTNELGMAIDVAGQLVWVRNNTQATGWTNAADGSLTGNPATGVGGYSFSRIGVVAIYIMATGTNDSVTLHTATGAGSPPSGFSFWG